MLILWCVRRAYVEDGTIYRELYVCIGIVCVLVLRAVWHNKYVLKHSTEATY